MPNPDLLSPGYAPFVVSNPDLEGLSAAKPPLRASHSLLRVPVLADCWGMVVSDEECSSDDNEFHGFDSNEEHDDDDMWKTRGAPVYKAKTGALLGEAVKKWHVRSARATEKRAGLVGNAG